MKIEKNILMRKVFKKTAALCAAMLLFANFTFINKENVEFMANGFAPAKSAVRQNVFNVSSHINKAAGIINDFFNAQNSKMLSASSGKENNPYNNNTFSCQPVVFLGASTQGSSLLQSLSAFLYLNGYGICKIYIDPGGREWPPGGFYLFISYFLIMLLFFASSRKVFNIALNYRTVKIPAYA